MRKKSFTWFHFLPNSKSVAIYPFNFQKIYWIYLHLVIEVRFGLLFFGLPFWSLQFIKLNVRLSGASTCNFFQLTFTSQSASNQAFQTRIKKTILLKVNETWRIRSATRTDIMRSEWHKKSLFSVQHDFVGDKDLTNRTDKRNEMVKKKEDYISNKSEEQKEECREIL